MPKINTMTRAFDRTAYQKLVHDIGSIYEGARRALMDAYWKIGERIVEGEQNGSLRAQYGTKLLERISEDLTQKHGRGFSVQNLRRMRRLYLAQPIRPPAVELGIAHQIELLPIRSPKIRRLLEKRAVRESLSRSEIRVLVRTAISKGKSKALAHPRAKNGVAEAVQAASLPSARPLTPVRGKLYTHKIVEKGGVLYLDLGFRNYRALSKTAAGRFKAGDVVDMSPGCFFSSVK